MDLTQTVAQAEQSASQAKPRGGSVNRDAYPTLSPDHEVVGGGIARIVQRASTGAPMLEHEPPSGRVQRIALHAVPAVGFAALTPEHRDALRELFPEDFGEQEQAHEPESN